MKVNFQTTVTRGESLGGWTKRNPGCSCPTHGAAYDAEAEIDQAHEKEIGRYDEVHALSAAAALE